MSELYVLQSEIDYRRERIRNQWRPMRRRRWQRRVDRDGAASAPSDQTWIH